MELSKNSHRNTWRAVHETTLAIRDGRLDPALTDWLRHQGVRLDEALFASVRQCDQRLFVGTLVDERGRVLEYLANLDQPDDDALDDVTDELGPKCSYHNRHDPCDPVTMALMIQRGQAPALAALPA